MRIAQVAPLIEPVPPPTYGGTERVVSYLTEELVRLGHDVTLFASADSRTAATLVPVCARAVRRDPNCRDPLAHYAVQIELLMTRLHEFDIVHYHTGFLHFSLARRRSVPYVTTMHGRLDLPEFPRMFDQFPDVPLVSISDAQRRPLPHANWRETVYHGLPEDDLLPFSPRSDGYVVFVGRISPEKRVDRAIEIATRAGLPLKIAAKVDSADRTYFTREIEPLLDTPGVEFIGEIGEQQKGALLGGAQALLFPIDWPEPFGMVVIEALACGTPVVAWNHGSVPELITPGVTGFIVQDMEEAIAAARRSATLDRHACRQSFLDRFTAGRMARDYVALYERLAESATGEWRMEAWRERAGRGPQPVLHSHSDRAARRAHPRSQAR